MTALENGAGGALDLALRLIGPEGGEIAYNDNHDSEELLNPTDAQIAQVMLPSSGSYQVIVEQVDGVGSYTLGLIETHPFTLEPQGRTVLSGKLNAVFPVEILDLHGSGRANAHSHPGGGQRRSGPPAAAL